LILSSPGCNKDDSSPTAPAPGAGNAPASPNSAGKPAPRSGYVSGKITMADGRPITTPGAKFNVNLSGVSAAGEKVYFSPIVNPGGAYSQKVPDGIYHMPYATITVPFEGKQYRLKLEPVNPTGDRESAAGITQDFVWKLTGPKPDTNVEINNHTHWYGESINCRFNTWRDDIKKSPPPLPPGTRLVFTLKPLTKLIDGSDAKTLTVERDWRPNDVTPNDNLNDLPPANYELSGVAKLPDGSTKPILLMGKGDYPKFNPSTKVLLEPNETMDHFFVPAIGWVTE
jgi:hypothetical protein